VLGEEMVEEVVEEIMVESVVGAQLRHSKSLKRPMVKVCVFRADGVYSAMSRAGSEEKDAFTVFMEYSQTRNCDSLMCTATL